MTNTSNPVYTQLSVIFVFILQSLKVKVVLSPFSSLFGAISWYCDFVLVLYFIGSGFWSMVSCCQTFSSFWLFPKILYCLGSKFWCFSFVSVLFLDLIFFSNVVLSWVRWILVLWPRVDHFRDCDKYKLTAGTTNTIQIQTNTIWQQQEPQCPLQCF